MNHTGRTRSMFGWLASSALLVCAPASWAQQAGNQGQIELLYIRAEWADATLPVSDSLWQDRLIELDEFAEEYWQFHSSGFVTNFTRTLTPRLQFSGPAPTPDNPISPGSVRAQMVALAQGAGFIINDYDHIVLSYPSVAHTISFGALGTPGTVWMPGAAPWGPGFVHEMGHAFGVGHANHWEGGTEILPGEHREGRDGLFMMGSEGGALGGRSTINMPMRYRMGHVGDGNVAAITASGIYRLYEFELATPPVEKLTAIHFPVAGPGAGDWWISFAPTMVERWANFGSQGFAQGVIVQQLSGSITHSLDFTPQSQGGVGTNEEDYVDTRDGALQIGNSYTFPASTLTIEPLQVGTNDGLRWIDVSVDFGDAEGPLLVREEFDGYAPGELAGQPGLGLGLTDGTWNHTQGTGSFEIVAGLSGDQALGLSSGGGRDDLRIRHNLGLWGVDRLWFSFLYAESNTVGAFWASGSNTFSGAVGHPAGLRTWAINGTTTPGQLSFDLGATHRVIARFDWQAGTTTLWVDATSLPILDPSHPDFAPAAFLEQVPPAASRRLLLSFQDGTAGTVDDLRIGTTFESVVEPGQEYCFATDCPCGNDAQLTGCANSTGSGASLRSGGTARIASDDLELRLEGAVPGQSAVLFLGGANDRVPFGDGLRCVSAGSASLCRLSIQATDGSGRAAWTNIVTSSLACPISAGSSWYFQGWYRDPAGPCGTGFNLSSARSLLFVP